MVRISNNTWFKYSTLFLMFLFLLSTGFSTELLTDQKVEDSKLIINFILDDVKDIGSLDLVLSYNPKVLTFDKLKKGSIDGLLDYDKDDSGLLALSLVDPNGITGKVKIFSIEFKIKKQTSSKIIINHISVYDSKNHIEIPINYNDINVNLSVKPTQNKEDLSNNYKDSKDSKSKIYIYAGILFILLTVIYFILRGKNKSNKKNNRKKNKK